MYFTATKHPQGSLGHGLQSGLGPNPGHGSSRPTHASMSACCRRVSKSRPRARLYCTGGINSLSAVCHYFNVMLPQPVLCADDIVPVFPTELVIQPVRSFLWNLRRSTIVQMENLLFQQPCNCRDWVVMRNKPLRAQGPVLARKCYYRQGADHARPAPALLKAALLEMRTEFFDVTNKDFPVDPCCLFWGPRRA